MADSPDDVVELRPAYSWTCFHCGRDMFARAIVPELSAEEESELREEFGIQPWDLGKFQTYPDVVTCSFCLTAFRTVGFPSEDAG